MCCYDYQHTLSLTKNPSSQNRLFMSHKKVFWTSDTRRSLVDIPDHSCQIGSSDKAGVDGLRACISVVLGFYPNFCHTDNILAWNIVCLNIAFRLMSIDVVVNTYVLLGHASCNSHKNLDVMCIRFARSVSAVPNLSLQSPCKAIKPFIPSQLMPSTFAQQTISCQPRLSWD